MKEVAKKRLWSRTGNVTGREWCKNVTPLSHILLTREDVFLTVYVLREMALFAIPFHLFGTSNESLGIEFNVETIFKTL